MHPKRYTKLMEVHFYVKKKEFNTKCSPEFKVSVILNMREHGMSYNDSVRKYCGLNVK